MNTQDIPMDKLVPDMGRAYYKLSATPDNLSGPVSKSLLWQFNKSPLKWLANPSVEPTPAMDLGTAVHAIALQPDKWQDIVAVGEFNDYRTKDAQTWRDEQRAAGKVVMLSKELPRAFEIAEAVMESEHVWGYGHTDKEIAAFAKVGGTMVKCIIDMIPHRSNALADIKTTATIGDLRQLRNKVQYDGGYHWQAALYLDIYNTVTGESRDEFHLLFVETEPPYEMAVVRLSGAWLELGRQGYMNAIAKWQQCVSSKKFPAAHDGIIDLPM